MRQLLNAAGKLGEDLASVNPVGALSAKDGEKLVKRGTGILQGKCCHAEDKSWR